MGSFCYVKKEFARGKWSLEDTGLRHHTIVAECGNEIVGFGDIDDTGYLDRLYVHKDHQGKAENWKRSQAERRFLFTRPVQPDRFLNIGDTG